MTRPTTIDLTPHTPEAVALLNAVEGRAYFYELPFELSDHVPPLNNAEAVEKARHALSTLLATGLVEIIRESHSEQPPVTLRLNEAKRIIAAATSWQLPQERERAPLYLFEATAAGRKALLG